MGEGQRILIAVDGSEQSEKATKWYVDHLYQKGDIVILAHVVEAALEPTFGFRAGLAIPREEWHAMQKAEEEKTTKLKQKFAAILHEKNIPTTFVREHGDPGHHLVDISTREKIDLIVMGTRGLGSVRRTILGSVSDYLLHHAHAQVCICKQ